MNERTLKLKIEIAFHEYRKYQFELHSLRTITQGMTEWYQEQAKREGAFVDSLKGKLEELEQNGQETETRDAQPVECDSGVHSGRAGESTRATEGVEDSGGLLQAGVDGS